MSFLSIQNINKTYSGSEGKIQVLKDFSLDLEAGKIHAFVGPSGCGKSTLLMLCGGLISQDSGDIAISGESLLNFPERKRASRRAHLVGFVFQRFHLIPYLNVEQNIMASCVTSHVENAGKRCNELLQQLGLEHRRKHIPATLSAGEQQRVALGRAIMHNPPLLVADEPTGNLDEENTTILMNLLCDYAKKGGLVLMATHNMAVANSADKKYTYHNGIFEKDRE
jgi:ABC-type lipoprotein export system ATPase subunit